MDDAGQARGGRDPPPPPRRSRSPRTKVKPARARAGPAGRRRARRGPARAAGAWYALALGAAGRQRGRPGNDVRTTGAGRTPQRDQQRLHSSLHLPNPQRRGRQRRRPGGEAGVAGETRRPARPDRRSAAPAFRTPASDVGDVARSCGRLRRARHLPPGPATATSAHRAQAALRDDDNSRQHVYDGQLASNAVHQLHFDDRPRFASRHEPRRDSTIVRTAPPSKRRRQSVNGRPSTDAGNGRYGSTSTSTSGWSGSSCQRRSPFERIWSPRDRRARPPWQQRSCRRGGAQLAGRVVWLIGHRVEGDRAPRGRVARAAPAAAPPASGRPPPPMGGRQAKGRLSVVRKSGNRFGKTCENKNLRSVDS